MRSIHKNGTYVWCEDDTAPLGLLEATLKVFSKHLMEGEGAGSVISVEHHRDDGSSVICYMKRIS